MPKLLQRKPRVYIAGPYSHGDIATNVRMAIHAADKVAEAGGAPFVPHLTHFWHMLCPHDYEFWLEQDAEWLLQCQAVLRLPGVSDGAEREVKLAAEAGIPVFAAISTCEEWLRSFSGAREAEMSAEDLAHPEVRPNLRELLGAVSKAVDEAERDRYDEIHGMLYGAYLVTTTEPMNFSQLLHGFPGDPLADNSTVKNWRASAHAMETAADLLRSMLQDIKRRVLKS